MVLHPDIHQGEAPFMPSAALLEYIWVHRFSDVRSLALSAKELPIGVELKEALSAIQARQKLAQKHPLWAQVPEVFIPEVVMVEQSSSPETAKYKEQFVTFGGVTLDLSGGLGADTWALAQRSRRVEYLEASPHRAALAEHNFLALGQTNIGTHSGKAEVEGIELAQKYQPQLIYLDPDRRPDATARVFRIEECSPNIITLIPQLQSVSPESHILLKLSPMADLTYLRTHFPHNYDIYVVSLRREAKEILLHLHPEASGATTAVELQAHRTLEYTAPEGEGKPTPIESEVGKYLHDLYPAFAKVGYDRLSLSFEVWQPAPHTHLYFSHQLLENFPGRSFEVLEHNSGEKRWLKNIAKEPLHIVAKNLPTNTEQLRQQLKIKEGGNLFLFAYSDAQAKKHFVLVRPIH